MRATDVGKHDAVIGWRIRIVIEQFRQYRQRTTRRRDDVSHPVLAGLQDGIDELRGELPEELRNLWEQLSRGYIQLFVNELNGPHADHIDHSHRLFEQEELVLAHLNAH